jgi:histidinol-phosphate aminotransferase
MISSSAERSNFAKRGVTRRNFGRVATLLTAGATLPFYNEHALAQLSMVRDLPADAVKINANENPLGPCPEAAEAIRKVVTNGGRYMYETEFEMAQTLAEIEGIKFSYDPSRSYLLPFAGSSQPLHCMVVANCNEEKPFIVADPGYEAGARAAEFVGAKVIKVPLRADTKAHDVKAMVAAHPAPGIIYICNPNNPTGTVTSRADIEWAVANQPKGSIILLDEAYVHFAQKTERNSHLVAADKDVVILRTFSKLYGMAGLRAGAALARPDLLAALRKYNAGALPITGMVGATTSLKTKGLIEQRKTYMTGVRDDVFEFLSKNDIEFIPSDANMFMMNAKRPGKEFGAAMAREKVYVGRVWPIWPTWVRVSVGTKEEMARFKQACSKCYAA